MSTPASPTGAQGHTPDQTSATAAPSSTSPSAQTSTPGAASTSPVTPSRPYNFILALSTIVLATIIFGIVMAIFRGAFTDAALVTTALSTLFGIFGTVVGAYFGIKSSNDTLDKTRRDVAEANDKVSRALAALPPDDGMKVMEMSS